jgi:Ran GTPase-activating protein (RanGAP) involved in mRNA processing and transport
VPWDEANPDPDARVEFPRGIFYSDGRMDLCKQVVGPGSISPLMDCLRHNSHIRHFLLGNNVIGPVGARAVSDFIAHKSKVVTWYLAGNCIDGKGVEMIAAALGEDETVEALWLKRNPVGLVGARHLSDMLRTNVKLHTLDLDNCGLLDSGIAALVGGLKGNDTLRHLYLSANGITPAGAASLGDYFADCSANGKQGLESLYLSVNRIGDAGAKALADGLRCNRALRRLVLSSNQIEAEGAAALCAALKVHQTLEVLELGVYTSTADMGEPPNRIEDSGALCLAELIRSSANLLAVNVAHNGLTEAGWEAVVRATLDSPSLVHLDVVERGLRKEPGLQKQLVGHLEGNIRARFNVSRGEFLRTKLKFVRQPETVRYIESLYRTRDFQNRAKRRAVKKFWDEDDETLKRVAMSAREKSEKPLSPMCMGNRQRHERYRRDV